MIACIGRKARNNRPSKYLKAVHTLGGGTLNKVELNTRSFLKALNDPQDFVTEILQEPGEPLGPPVTPMPPL